MIGKEGVAFISQWPITLTCVQIEVQTVRTNEIVFDHQQRIVLVHFDHFAVGRRVKLTVEEFGAVEGIAMKANFFVKAAELFGPLRHWFVLNFGRLG